MILKLGREIFTKRVILRFNSTSNVKMSVGEGVGVSLNKVVSVLENFAPKQLAENWDNTGLLVEPYSPRAISSILLTNDLTEEVALEANDKGCEMIISYHPPIFAPLKSVVQSSWKEKIVAFLLEKRIALYSPHTSWDSVQGGVNDWLASAFPARVSTPILANASNPKYGAGRFLELKSSVTLIEAIAKVKELTGLSHVRFAMARKKTMTDLVSTVALCAGAGTSVLKGVAADLYVTGEMLHHDVLDATQKGISVILTNHSDSERGYLKVFDVQLKARLEGEVKVIVSSCDKDPLVTV